MGEKRTLCVFLKPMAMQLLIFLFDLLSPPFPETLKALDLRASSLNLGIQSLFTLRWWPMLNLPSWVLLPCSRQHYLSIWRRATVGAR